MAKRKAVRRGKSTRMTTKRKASSRSAKRPSAKRPAKRQASATKKAPARNTAKNAQPKAKKAQPRVAAKKKTDSRKKPTQKARGSTAAPAKVPRLDRARRTLVEAAEPHSTPSSLDMDRHGSAARTGRAETAQKIREHHGMDEVTGGDPDVNIEDAYFAGEEAPGGDNPTPDQDIVEDIGKALGITYEDNEQLKGADKLVERAKHRWELDPASSEDYSEHDKD